MKSKLAERIVNDSSPESKRRALLYGQYLMSLLTSERGSEKRRKNVIDRYKSIAKSIWFKEAYTGMSADEAKIEE